MLNLLAHGGEEAVSEANQGLLDALTHQPVWAALLITAFILFGIYSLLEKLGVKLLNRVIGMVPLLILLSILYLEHNSAVTAVLLSLGFVASFFLAFSMMSSQKNKDKKDSVDKQDETA